jgi:hypothetical protein
VVADVGPQWPEGFLRHRWRHWEDEAVGGEAERVLQNVQGNLSRLTQRIPMVQVEDLPEAMQRQVVGVPRAWVCMGFLYDSSNVISNAVYVFLVLAPIIKRDLRMYLYLPIQDIISIGIRYMIRTSRNTKVCNKIKFSF